MTAETRYWLSRYDDGIVSALVRIRKQPGALWTEVFRQGRWHEHAPAVRYLYDPLAGDEISEEEAATVVRELGYEWPGDPAPPPPDESEPPLADGAAVRRADRALADTARKVAAGRASPQDLHEAFLDAQVFCEAGERPGFVAVGAPGEGVVPVFSSEEQLARARGPVPWFATTGADLFGLLPEGYDVVLDIAGEHPLRLRRAAVGFTSTEAQSDPPGS